MLIQIPLALLVTATSVGRDRFRIGDVEYRVCGWNADARALEVLPVTAPAEQ